MTATAELPIEGTQPDLGGATAWLNSEPLTPAGLRGKVVVVQFCTFSCVNWLRTLPYVRAWSERYRDDGLAVIGEGVTLGANNQVTNHARLFPGVKLPDGALLF